jgi:REP element-mobilizing transposase RayT
MHRDQATTQRNPSPIAFLITFRCYGTWFHGDERGSVGKKGSNRYGGPKIVSSEVLPEMEASALTSPPYELGVRERKIVEYAIREVCEFRSYPLVAVNVRTNHAHVVVGNGGNVERMMDSFKAYSTRALRKAGLVENGRKIWSRHGSTRYLWNDGHLAAAVDYVLNGQGGEPPQLG